MVRVLMGREGQGGCQMSFSPPSSQPGRTSDSKLPSSPGFVALDLMEAGSRLEGPRSE
jgi:hypothetical protein